MFVYFYIRATSVKVEGPGCVDKGEICFALTVLCYYKSIGSEKNCRLTVSTAEHPLLPAAFCNRSSQSSAIITACIKDI